MTDRELLELAAKAAGYSVHGWIVDRFIVNFVDGQRGEWDPLTDNSCAFHLAACLELDIMHRVVSGRRVEVLPAGGPLTKHFYEGDVVEATRRAIVRAAAEIGRSLP